MSEIHLVKISIDRVQADMEPEQPCNICQHAFKIDDIRTTFSCCHALHHAECLSEWLVADRGQSGLPKCTRCKASFYPNSFHYAMTQLATRSVHLLPGSETRAVSRIRLEVRPSVEEELYYNPAGLLRRALRGENPEAAQAFEDERFSTQPEAGREQQTTDRNINASASTRNQTWDDRYSADDSESNYSSPYEDEEATQQEPVRAAEARERRYGTPGTEDTFSAVHVEDIAAEASTNNSYHTNPPAMTAEAQNDPHAPVRRIHWLYGRGHTIGDRPERESPSNHNDTTAPSDGFSLPPPLDEAADEFVPLYTRIHGFGQRLGDAPVVESGDHPMSTNTNASNRPQAPVATLNRTPASLHSNSHGHGFLLGTGELNAESTPYLYQAGRGTGTGRGTGRSQGREASLTEQLRVLGRFRHELGQGRTLGE